MNIKMLMAGLFMIGLEILTGVIWYTSTLFEDVKTILFVICLGLFNLVGLAFIIIGALKDD